MLIDTRSEIPQHKSQFKSIKKFARSDTTAYGSCQLEKQLSPLLQRAQRETVYSTKYFDVIARYWALLGYVASNYWIRKAGDGDLCFTDPQEYLMHPNVWVLAGSPCTSCEPLISDLSTTGLSRVH